MDIFVDQEQFLISKIKRITKEVSKPITRKADFIYPKTNQSISVNLQEIGEKKVSCVITSENNLFFPSEFIVSESSGKPLIEWAINDIIFAQLTV